jgi:RND family efflux transporter MFP subunit
MPKTDMSRRQTRLWLAAGAALVLLAALLLALRIQERLRVPAVVDSRPLPVEVVTVQPRPFPVYIESVGTVAAVRRILVSAQLSATVLAVPNREGAPVERGTVLVELDEAEVRRELQKQQAATERARTELGYWRKELEADRKLFDKGMLERRRMDDSRRQVSALEASLAEAEAQLEIARLRLDWSTVTAPWPGFVQSNLVLEGEQVHPGTAMVELVAAEPLKIVVPVAERDLARLAEGQVALVRIPAAGVELESRVHRIYPALDRPSRNATVELSLSPQQHALMPGMAAEVRVLTRLEPAALAVPRHAIRLQQHEEGVFVVEGGTARWRSVSTGAAQGDQVIVAGGIHAGEQVIVTPHPGLTEGRAVLSADRLSTGAAGGAR